MTTPQPCLTTVLGIDPSADVTGVALVSFDDKGTQGLLCYTSFDAYALTEQSKRRHTSLTHRLARIRATRKAISKWCADAFCADEPAPSLLAYESPFGAGFDAQTLNQAIGAYTALSRFDGVPTAAIAPISVKAIWHGVQAARQKTHSPKEREAKRRAAKLQGVEWARQTFDIDLWDTDDAISDALGVCVAAYRLRLKQSQELLEQAAQKPLLGTGSGKPREKR